MTHDPLCPFAKWDDVDCYQHDAGVRICDLIAKVREDERDGIQAVRLRTLFNEQGYRDGQRDMLAKHTHAPDPWCDCERIKRAEQRVTRSKKRVIQEAEHWRSKGYAAALNAAREAVAALDIGRDVRFSVDVQADAVAAIDALKEKP